MWGWRSWDLKLKAESSLGGGQGGRSEWWDVAGSGSFCARRSVDVRMGLPAAMCGLISYLLLCSAHVIRQSLPRVSFRYGWIQGLKQCFLFWLHPRHLRGIVLNLSPIDQQDSATVYHPNFPTCQESLRVPSCWTSLGHAASLRPALPRLAEAWATGSASGLGM